MANFWDKNRQKSKWAFLLLLLRWRKGVVPLVLLVLLIVLFASVPSRILVYFTDRVQGIPFVGRSAARGITYVAARAGVDGFADDQRSFGRLKAAFRQAREGNGDVVTMMFRNIPPDEKGREESLLMVRADLGGDGSSNLGARIQGGTSVRGILTPEESREEGRGIALDAGDNRARSSRIAEASAAEAGGERQSVDASSSPYLPAWFNETAGHAANPDDIHATLGTGSVPIASRNGTATRRPVGWSAPNDQMGTAGGAARDYVKSGKCNHGEHDEGRCGLSQLVQVRNTGIMSSNPICTTANGCPKEYASSNMGQVYDGYSLKNFVGNVQGPVSCAAGGGNTTPCIISAPAIDGVTRPMMPNAQSNIGTRQIGDVSGSFNTDDSESLTGQLEQCENQITACQDQSTIYTHAAGVDAGQLSGLIGQLASQCVSMCPYAFALLDLKKPCGSCFNTLTQIQTICNQLKSDLGGLFNAKTGCISPSCSADFCASDPSGLLCQGTGAAGAMQTRSAGISGLAADGTFIAVTNMIAQNPQDKDFQALQGTQNQTAFQMCEAFAASGAIDTSNPNMQYNCVVYEDTTPTIHEAYCCYGANDQDPSCNAYAPGPPPAGMVSGLAGSATNPCTGGQYLDTHSGLCVCPAGQTLDASGNCR